MNIILRILFAILFLLRVCVDSAACTSMIVSASASESGRPLLWKHRDTGADNNFLERVEPRDGGYSYVGLFNAGDSLLAEAWMGMNDRGFAIMNTASYNLAPDTARLVDREGAVMAEALRRCVTVDDFEVLLGALPKPLGVQANFGVIDACGGAAYFETSDHAWTRYDVADAPDGVLVRSNFSVSGRDGEGSGYIRYNTACRLVAEAVANRSVTPELLTEGLSRSFMHSLLDMDCEGMDIVVNQDFIPRDISTSSIVIEGVNSPSEASDMRMWAALGYPPCAAADLVTLHYIPEGFRPVAPGWRSPACDEAMALRRSTIPYPGGSGPRYIDMRRLRPISAEMRRRALENYARARKK